MRYFSKVHFSRVVEKRSICLAWWLLLPPLLLLLLQLLWLRADTLSAAAAAAAAAVDGRGAGHLRPHLPPSRTAPHRHAAAAAAVAPLLHPIHDFRCHSNVDATPSDNEVQPQQTPAQASTTDTHLARLIEAFSAESKASRDNTTLLMQQMEERL